MHLLLRPWNKDCSNLRPTGAAVAAVAAAAVAAVAAAAAAAAACPHPGDSSSCKKEKTRDV